MAAGSPPLLFLLEELLSTTNSHDRRTGARAVLTSLLQRGAVGMATTHDLAVTRLAGEVDAVRNVHFEDHIVDGEIRFDYRLRDGVVERSNAVELMRSIGLDV
jgi:DNA mismatch repair ATPase MutS